MEFGFASLLPPLIAIILAVATRKVVLPLAAGVAVGAIILAYGRVEVVSDLGTNGAVKVRDQRPFSIFLSGILGDRNCPPCIASRPLLTAAQPMRGSG